MGPPVAVNIDICEYLRFLSITFLLHIYGVQYATDNLLVTREFLFHRPVLIFKLTENSRASDNQSMRCQKRSRSSWRNAHLLSEDVYIGVCEGV